MVNPTIGIKTYIFYDNDTDKNTDGEWIEWKAKYRGLGDNVKDFIKEYHEDLNKIVDVTNPKIGEGYDVTINDSEEGNLSFKVNGRTLQDVCKDKSNFLTNKGSYDNGVITLTQKTSDVSFTYSNENFILKKNTTYTLILEVLENTIESSSLNGNTNQVFNISSTGLGYGSWTIKTESSIAVSARQTGVIRRKFVYRTDNVGVDGRIIATGGYVLKHTSNPSGYIKFKLMFLEGDHTNTPIEELPYIEGIQSVGDLVEDESNVNFGKYKVEVKSESYEPYHEDIKTYYLNEPLRGLPNGVCDTIEKDKVVRRVGKIVLNSANYNDWKKSDWNMNDIVRFDYTKSTTFAKGYSNIINLICDKFYAVDRDYLNLEENRNQECISINTTGQISINISKLKLSKEDVDGLSAWLQANPTTVYYELATPIEQQLPTIPTINSYNDVTHIYSTNYIQPFIEIFDTVSIFKDANQYLNIESDRTFALPNMDDLEDNAVKEIHMYIYMKEEATLTFPSDIKWETLSEFGKGDYVEIILTYVKTNGVGQWLGSAIVYNG